MKKAFSEFFQVLSCVFFPQRCLFCGKPIEPTARYCTACAESVRRVELPICFACGCSRKDCKCSRKRNRYIAAFAAPFYYDKIVRKCVHTMKFSHKFRHADTLGEEMGEFAEEVFREVHIDFVTFVPMTEKERRKSRFNHSERMAQAVARKLQLPMKAVLCKLYETPHQRSLSRERRNGNVFGVFDVTDPAPVHGKRILLCDDVQTTGSTLNECAKMLMIHGAREVLCLTAAVAIPPPKTKDKT